MGTWDLPTTGSGAALFTGLRKGQLTKRQPQWRPTRRHFILLARVFVHSLFYILSANWHTEWLYCMYLCDAVITYPGRRVSVGSGRSSTKKRIKRWTWKWQNDWVMPLLNWLLNKRIIWRTDWIKKFFSCTPNTTPGRDNEGGGSDAVMPCKTLSIMDI